MSKEEALQLSSFEDFTEIGRGAFGVVYKAIYKKNNKPCAIKKISKKKIRDQKMEQQVMNEIQISYKLKHPRIIELYKVISETDSISLVLELAENGQLYTRLMQKKRLDEEFAKKIISQIISALKYLHNLKDPIIHRDIKPENILLDKNDDVKLADFGWSNYSNQKRTTYCGTHEYLAPEMIDQQNQKGHNQKLDIWCLGVLTYEILVGNPPFTPEPSKSSFNEERNKLYENILSVKVVYPKDFPPLAQDFVSKILKRNPEQRATLTQLQEHPWLKSNPVSKIPTLPTMAVSPKKQLVQQSESRNKTVIDSLNKKVQDLQKQLQAQKIKQGLRKPQPLPQKNFQKQIKQDQKRIKDMEQITQKYKRELENMHGQLNNKNKQILKMKGELKSVKQIKHDSEQYKTQRDSMEDKYRGLSKMHEELTQKYLDITTTLENERLEFNTKLKEAKRNGKNPQSSESIGIIGDLQQAMAELSKKYSQSKKLIAEVSRKDSNLEHLEKQIHKLRFQQNKVKDDVKYQLKEYYQTKIDEVMMKAREELQIQKQKWARERDELVRMHQPSQSTNYSSNTTHSNREIEIDQELRSTRELNQMLERRVKDQEYKIKDLEEMLKRKK